jgi:hypothetical protein
MSRTLPRAAGEMPAKFVSRKTRIAAPEGKTEFPLTEFPSAKCNAF